MLANHYNFCKNGGMVDVSVDFVAFDDARGACLLVLVEEAWQGSPEDHLHHLQARLFGCLDASLDGQVAELFPKSLGMMIILRVDCYDLPREPIDDFVQRFATGIGQLADYSTDSSRYVRGFQFEVNHSSIKAG